MCLGKQPADPLQEQGYLQPTYLGPTSRVSVFTLESGQGKGLLQAPQVLTVHKIKVKGVPQIEGYAIT